MAIRSSRLRTSIALQPAGSSSTRPIASKRCAVLSRTAIMTGLRPDTTKVWDLVTHFRAAQPDCVTLPQHFKANGYHCAAINKIYHKGFEDGRSWSEPHWYSSGKSVDTDLSRLHQTARDETRCCGRRVHVTNDSDKDTKPGPAFEVESQNRELTYRTEQRPAEAVKRLSSLKAKKEPFFLAVGFAKASSTIRCSEESTGTFTIQTTIPVPTMDRLA